MVNLQEIKWYNVRRELDDQEVTRDMVKIMANKNGWVLEYLDKKYLSDKEIVMMAVKNNGNAFSSINEKFWSDTDVILAARNVFAAYLISSAVSIFVKMMGVSSK